MADEPPSKNPSLDRFMQAVARLTAATKNLLDADKDIREQNARIADGDARLRHAAAGFQEAMDTMHDVMHPSFPAPNAVTVPPLAYETPGPKGRWSKDN